MKRIIITSFLTLLFLSCEESIPTIIEVQNIFSAPTSIKNVTNTKLLQDIQEKFDLENSNNLNSDDVLFSESKEVMFEGKETKSIVTPIKTSNELETNLITYLTADEQVSDVLFINENKKISDNAYVSTYSTIGGIHLYSLKIENGLITFLKSNSNINNRIDSSTPCPMEKWAECVGAVAGQLTDGSLLGSASFIACIIWSGYCAAGITVGCATLAIGLCSEPKK